MEEAGADVLIRFARPEIVAWTYCSGFNLLTEFVCRNYPQCYTLESAFHARLIEITLTDT